MKRQIHAIKEAAVALNVHPKTLRRWTSDGAPHEKPNGVFRFDIAAVREWMQATGRGGTPGRPDLTEERLRKAPVVPCREALVIEPDALAEIMGPCAVVFDAIAPKDTREACNVFSLAIEVVLLDGEPCLPMPEAYWWERLQAFESAEPDKVATWAIYCVTLLFDRLMKRAKWLAMLPSADRKVVSSWLKAVDAID